MNAPRRWRSQPDGDSEEARAGALFRSVEVVEPTASARYAAQSSLRSGRARRWSAIGVTTVIVASAGLVSAAIVATRAWRPSTVAPVTSPSQIRTAPIEPKPIRTAPIEPKRIRTAPVEPKPIRTAPIEPQPVRTAPIEPKQSPPDAETSETIMPAPIVSPRHKPKVVRSEPSTLAAEAALLRDATSAMQAGRVADALRYVATYEADHPRGTLAREVFRTKVVALVASGQSAAALAELRGEDLRRHPRAGDLYVLRAELSIQHGDCVSAITDLETAAARGVSGERMTTAAKSCRGALKDPTLPRHSPAND